MMAGMIFGFTILCGMILPCISFEHMHRIVKRSLSERNLPDPGSCVQNCFIKQNKAIAEDSPGNSTRNSSKPISIHKNISHPAVRGCEIHKIAVECLKDCPDSEAKSLYLDSIMTETTQCNVSIKLLKAQWDCVSNDTLVAAIKSCNSKCPSIPLGLTESIGLSPNSAQVVFINYESDENVVEKDLIDSCHSASCLWPCMKPIVESKCGTAVAAQSNAINKAEIQSVAKTFIDLKVIKKIPAECRKFLGEE